MAYVIAMEQVTVPIYQIEQFAEKEMFPKAYERLLINMGCTSEYIPDIEFFMKNFGKEFSGESLKIYSKLDFPSDTITIGFYDLNELIYKKYTGWSCTCCQYYSNGEAGMIDCLTPYIDPLAIVPGTNEFKERQTRDQYFMGIKKGICPYMAFKFREYCPEAERMTEELCNKEKN